MSSQIIYFQVSFVWTGRGKGWIPFSNLWLVLKTC